LESGIGLNPLLQTRSRLSDLGDLEFYGDFKILGESDLGDLEFYGDFKIHGESDLGVF